MYKLIILSFPMYQMLMQNILIIVVILNRYFSEQIVSSVKWQQSIKEMIRQGVNLFIEVGPGSTLTNLIRKIDWRRSAK